MTRFNSLLMLLVVHSCLSAEVTARLGHGLQLLAVNGTAYTTDSSMQEPPADSSSSLNSRNSSALSTSTDSLPDRQSQLLNDGMGASNVVGSNNTAVGSDTGSPNSSSSSPLLRPALPSPGPQSCSQAMLTLLQRFRHYRRSPSPHPSPSQLLSPVPVQGAAMFDRNLLDSSSSSSSSSTNTTLLSLLNSARQQGQPTAANSTAAGPQPSSFPLVPSPGQEPPTRGSSVQGQSTNFQRALSTTFVRPGETLVYRGAVLSQLADLFSYNYKPSQPYINQAVGYVLWPSIALAPNATITLQDVQASYINPSLLDTCQEHTFKQLGGLQASLGTAGVSALNGTAIKIDGPVTVNVLVQDGQQQSTIGTATANYNNVVFTCLPNPQVETGLAVPDMGPGLGPGPSTGFGPGTGPNLGPGAGPGMAPSSEPGFNPGFQTGPGAGPNMGPGSGPGPSTGTGFGPGAGPTMMGMQSGQGTGASMAPSSESGLNVRAGSAPDSVPSMAPSSEPGFADTDFGPTSVPSPEPGASPPARSG